jgi:hypothetical protein
MNVEEVDPTPGGNNVKSNPLIGHLFFNVYVVLISASTMLAKVLYMR